VRDVRAINLPRRQFLHLAVSAVAASAIPRLAAALDYPARPVRIIVGFLPAPHPTSMGELSPNDYQSGSTKIQRR